MRPNSMPTKRRLRVAAALLLAASLTWGAAARADAPAQRLPSAILIYPLIAVEGGGATTDTRLELVNLSRHPVNLHCLFVPASSCSEIDFLVQLTPNQPLSWLASAGLFTSSLTAIPPFFGSSGEMKCFVVPDPGQETLDDYNAIQGRAAVFGADSQTIGYSAVGIQRVSEGPFTSNIELDGSTYAQCPDEQHFLFVSSETGNPQTESEIVLAPCSEDLANLTTSPTVVQFLVINEFEQQLSAAISVTCNTRRTLRQINQAFTRATLGSETGHVIVRGVQTPVLAMLIDRFVTPEGGRGTAGNEPALRGGRSAEILLP
jgi:hypothetical protein